MNGLELEQKTQEILNKYFHPWANALSEYYKGFEDGVRAALEVIDEDSKGVS